MRIYVGNLPYSIKDQDLHDLFAVYGKVDSANIIYDHESHNSKGYGFVAMPDDQEAQQVISTLDGSDYQGRRLTVRSANPRKSFSTPKSEFRARNRDYNPYESEDNGESGEVK